MATIPKYQNRNNFVPLNLDDFGGGGAFPEIHILQYPLNMGKPGSKSTAVVTVDIDDKGQVRFDAIVKQNSSGDKIIRTSIEDIKESDAKPDDLALPEVDEAEIAAEKTRLALEALIDGKLKKATPSSAVVNLKGDETQYIRYTPNEG